MDENTKEKSEELKVEEIKEENIETTNNKAEVDKIMEKQITFKVYQIIIFGLLIIILILSYSFFKNFLHTEYEENYLEDDYSGKIDEYGDLESVYSGKNSGEDVKILLQKIESFSGESFSGIMYNIYYSDNSSFYHSNMKFYADHLMDDKEYIETINNIISIIDDSHVYYVSFAEYNESNVYEIGIFYQSTENPYIYDTSETNNLNNADDDIYEDDMNGINSYETNNDEIENFESDNFIDLDKYRRYKTINEYLNEEFNCLDYEYLLELLVKHGSDDNTQLFYTVNILKDYSTEKDIESQVIEKIVFSDILTYKNNIEDLKKYSISENIYRVVSIDDTTMNIYIDVYSTGIEQYFSQKDIIYTNQYLSGKNVLKIIDAAVNASKNGEVFQIYYYDKNSYDKSTNIFEVTKIIKLINPDKYTEEVEKLKAKINLHHIYDIGVDAGEDHILCISEVILEE